MDPGLAPKHSGLHPAVKLAIYARVSSQSQHDDLPPQVDRLRSLAAARWPAATIAEFIDIESGATLRRPQLQRLLGEIDKRRVAIVLIEKLDRLSRSLSDGIHLVDRIASAGAGLVALDQPIDTSTPAGRAGLHLLQVFAEWQRADLRERSLKGIAAAKAKGVRFGRPKTPLDLEAARPLVKRYGVTWAARKIGVSRFVLSRALRA